MHSNATVYDNSNVRETILKLHAVFDKQKATALSGVEQWDISKHIDRKLTLDKPATYTEMMPLWFGKAALVEVPASRISEYRDFLSKQLGFNNFDEIIIHLRDKNNGLILEADLGLVFYFAFIEYIVKELAIDTQTVIPVLEIGGANGACAELLMRLSKYKFHFCMVDAVPESIAYCESYLTTNLPNENVIMFDEGKFDLASPGFTIVPAWEAHKLPDSMFAISTNVANIQEMPDDTALAYIDFFKRKLKSGGKLFFANSREFHYPRQYHFGKDFRLEYCEHSPRSRLLDYPIQIWAYGEDFAKTEDRNIHKAYLYNLIERLQNKISDVESKNKAQAKKARDRQQKLTVKIDALKKSLDKNVEMKNSLKAKLLALKAAQQNVDAKAVSGSNSVEQNINSKAAKQVEKYKSRIDTLELALKNKSDHEETLKANAIKQNKAYQSRIEALEKALSNKVRNEEAFKAKAEKQHKAYQSRIEALEQALSKKLDQEEILKSKGAEHSKSLKERIKKLELALSLKVNKEELLKSRIDKLQGGSSTLGNGEEIAKKDQAST